MTIVARNATKLEEARAQITTVAEGSHVLAVCADVTIPEEAEGSVRRTVEKWGRINILESSVSFWEVLFCSGSICRVLYFKSYSIHPYLVSNHVDA